MLGHLVARHISSSYPDPPQPATAVNSVGREDLDPLSCDGPEDAATSHARFQGNKNMARQAMEPGEIDIHDDAPVLHMLLTQRLHSSVHTPAQTRRVRRRARSYKVEHLPDGTREMRRIMSNGTTRVVPVPANRARRDLRAHRQERGQILQV